MKNKKTIKALVVGLSLLPMLVFADTGAGITPDSPFYFLDRFDEFVRELLTFRKQDKVNLQLKFADERKAEIQDVTARKGKDDKAVKTAEQLLSKSLAWIESETGNSMNEDSLASSTQIQAQVQAQVQVQNQNQNQIRRDDDSDDNDDEDEDDDDEDRGRNRGQNTNTTPSAQTNTNTNTNTTTQNSYTMAEVATHNSSASCWSVVSGGVYDLTSWIGQHPGGAAAIKSICGVDGSADFNGQHGGAARPASELAGFKIGVLK